MTAPQLDAAGRPSVLLDESPSWWDPDSECTIVVARPGAERELWNEYVRGAQSNYRKHGVEQAIDSKALQTGEDTALFCVGINSSGEVVGGLRAKGPYRSAEESHAIVEWSGQPGLDAVHKMIADRLPFGVVEMKTAWVCDDPEQSRALTDTLARMPLHAMTMLDIQFAMATAAAYVLKRWLSSGGVLAAKIPATPYPDERYQTKMMWWDSRTFANHADAGQLSRYFAEAQRIGPHPGTADFDTLTSTAAAR
ncbi:MULTISPECIES: hypothetical protein [unclassified Mycolicibacterium]|uniref:hypothetical protein n=1 Tax=unclassified Mycolicibacterium TaxID=2636767 RepID=UPI0012DF68DE|nr:MULTISPECIES: hypothetical protein [unclassified Mycolicibacterium]MUL80794.1 hypothetical protein [Mycolicibacterium sp. CBMA 329]MUL86561.1 hypothetical protein [Mycolicibacterium sp. CBMA 331]MUM01422.1 hypothetical protein [Mycolicibacterium sp. CBMA 334]MUM27227.1 hypothetical protein [Mycolicibacterium sp. CBMA 295]MUM36857.1 hypothetical protein [Mycolicibacterium sp. CBMA 247]